MARSFSQLELGSAILKWLGRHGVGDMVTRQFNAVIKAADDIIAELDRPPVMATPNMGIVAWLASDDTGLSSRYMARVLAPAAGVLPSIPMGPPAYPRDADDFGRCVRLLDAAPELRPYLSVMADGNHGRVWVGLVIKWDELEKLFRQDDGKELSKRIYEIRTAAEAANQREETKA